MITRVRSSNYRSLRALDFLPHENVNIVVGDNEAGKSTILEVIALVLGGRVHGRWAADDLNPHWFTQDVVKDYFESLRNGVNHDLPTIDLEVFFKVGTAGAERLRGLHNSADQDCPGLRMRVIPDPDRSVELEEYLRLPDLPELIPTDLFIVDWRDFSGEKVTRQPRGLGFATVNMATVSSSSGVDYKLRQLLRDFVTPQESAKIALEHRKAKDSITSGVLRSVNDRINGEGGSFGVGLQMDQSANTNWDMSVTPHIEEIPFSSLGHGRQVSTKIALAMSRNSDRTRFVLVEEPENHLSHTGLMKILARINDLSNGRQLFITTHSSFVLNRLGFDSIHLMHRSELVPLSGDSISDETIRYFQKQSGYDTLRLAIAEKIVVVEGPSDEMIFNRAFQSIKGREPRECGIDVIALGTRGKRALELARALNKKIAVLRDNDGKDPSHWTSAAADLIQPGKREMFIGDVIDGHTLEPQLVSANDVAVLRRILSLEVDADVTEYMLANKTESAWIITESGMDLTWPDYIVRAVDFIDGH
ncbi:AAA family ATPase [Rhodococcus sp. P-2]|uniref:ATP-dependent nuclease n=1 Tax=Rhodococcus sp. P-2 TaxID=2795031 RepID=UPI0019056C5C|nr:AAA family ATPase [Rhodococcus sp. P-2]QQM20553.1 AAA family ATPase [Rhodococcus sp. P-2]